MPDARKGEQTSTIKAYGQQKINERTSPIIIPQIASITTIIVSVVSPFSIVMSSAIRLVRAPGALFSESNQQSYLYKIPRISSFLMLDVSSSPVYPSSIRSVAEQTEIPKMKPAHAHSQVRRSA